MPAAPGMVSLYAPRHSRSSARYSMHFSASAGGVASSSCAVCIALERMLPDSAARTAAGSSADPDPGAGAGVEPGAAGGAAADAPDAPAHSRPRVTRGSALLRRAQGWPDARGDAVTPQQWWRYSVVTDCPLVLPDLVLLEGNYTVQRSRFPCSTFPPSTSPPTFMAKSSRGAHSAAQRHC
jgi:hypothetical protein